MKTFIFGFLLATGLVFGLSKCLTAQVVADDFSDGDFTSNPVWTGDDAVFSVNTFNQLQLIDIVAEQSYLATSFTSTTLDNKEWRFYIKQSFAGSDANQSRVYFATNAPATAYSGSGSAGVTGYFFKLGEGGSGDVLRVFSDNGVSISEIASCTTNISASFELGIKILRDDAGNWEIWIDPTGGINYALETSFADNSFTNASALGMICSYTSSNADNFFFDDIYFGDVVVDTSAPVLLSATATSNITLDVLFNEPLLESVAELLSSYNVDGLGNPQTAVLDGFNNALVHVSFATSFNDNQTYVLECAGIQDLAENIASNQSAEFMWFVPAVPSYRSVVFNEILADPTPTVGLPEVEFIELYNASEETFDLAGWQLVNTSTPKVLPSYALEADSLVILCDDDNVSLFTNAIGIASFSALTNSIDSLTLLDNLGNVVDLLVYSIDWYASSEKSDGGWSLEQINPFFPCANSAANWGESVNTNGGTPGTQNSIYNDAPDTSIPVITAAEIIENNQLLVTLSESMNELSIANIDFTLLFLSASSIEWTPNLDGLLFTFTTDLDPEIPYEISISGISDCSGNLISSTPFAFLQGVVPNPGEILINEIYAIPTDESPMPNAEFVELFNRSERVLNLQGVKLNNGIIEDHFILHPDSFVVLADVSEINVFFFQFYAKTFLETFPTLSNNGLLVQLKDPNDLVLDEVNYDNGWYHDPNKIDGGWTLERINPNDPCSSKDNWKASLGSVPSIYGGGTPGTQNSVHSEEPDTAGPQLLYALSEPQESVTLIFNEPLDPSSLAGLDWTVNGEVQSNMNAQFANADGSSIVLYYGEMEAGVIYQFDLFGLIDCWGNNAGLVQGKFALPEVAEAGDIIINEILFAPFEGGNDFVEVYNNSLKNISLAGWKLKDAASGQTNTGKVITEMALILYPGEYLVLTEAWGTSLPSLYSGAISNRILEVEDVPEFSATDAVYLLMPVFGEVSDSVEYTEGQHFPLLNSTNGVSLERIAFNRPSSDITNWHSASQAAGYATPGYVNSQSDNNFVTDESFEVVTEMFSPDNDGYQDVATFAYTFDEGGYAGSITIYDSEGRKVRNLMRSELLGVSGSISWDGLNNENQKSPMGIYIVYFEVFNLNGDVSEFKRTCVLAHSLD
jgi:hypothetical protein